MSDELRRAWEAQTVEQVRTDPVRLRERAVGFERDVRRRNALELAAGAVVALAFGGVAAVAPDPVGALGAGSIALGALFVMAVLVARGRTSALPEALGAPTRAWRREELVRQRDLLASVGWWYLGPLVPGLALFLASAARRAETLGQGAVVAGAAAMSALVFIMIHRMNRAAAVELDAELRALEAEDV